RMPLIAPAVTLQINFIFIGPLQSVWAAPAGTKAPPKKASIASARLEPVIQISGAPKKMAKKTKVNPASKRPPRTDRIIVPRAGLDHGVGHSLLLLYDVKVSNGQKSKEFKDLGHSLSNTSLSDF